MDNLKLIVLDVPQDLSSFTNEHQAVFDESLASSIELAAQFKSNLVLLSYVYSSGAILDTWLNGTVIHNARKDAVNAQTQYLKALVSKLADQKLKIDIKVVWAKNFDQALDEAFPEIKPDLVVKPSQHHLFAAALIRQPSEWQLIRYPGVPVFLQQQPGKLAGKVLLTLDVGEVEVSQNGNRMLIQSMKKWCAITQSELHLLNAYPRAADLMVFAPAEWTIPQIQDTLKKQHLERLQALATATGVPLEQVHVAEGPVAQVIDDTAAKLGVSLVALASHCRRGVSGFFIGNTAEQVLENTRLNLLVLKPLLE